MNLLDKEVLLLLETMRTIKMQLRILSALDIPQHQKESLIKAFELTQEEFQKFKGGVKIC